MDRRIGIWGNGFDVSVPPGIASTDKLVVAGWDDTRNGTQLTQTQDLFTVDLQMSRIVGGGMSKGAKVALVAVGAVSVVGLLLLLGSRLASRRT